jgi:Rab-like protein 3
MIIELIFISEFQIFLVGVGKTSLVHLINKGSSIVRPPQTIGCTVGVKHITYGSPASSSSSIQGDSERDFFVELWDVSGHERYKDCRSLFYSQINGLSQPIHIVDPYCV